MSIEKNPLVSFITLNYNQTKVTCEFLDSCRKLSYPNLEIIVVDNASAEDPSEYFRKNYPEIILLRPPTNLGFTGGNNLGMNHCKGDYIFIVNNDTEVTPDIVERMLEGFEADPEIGVVCPKIHYFDVPNLMQFAGFTEINPFTGRNSCIGDKEDDKGQYNTPSYSPYAHGAAMLLKREVIEKAGVLFDKFFIYYEELDWSAKITGAGYKIRYQPTALIHHKESVTMGRESPIKAYYLHRNRIMFMRRNSTFFQLGIFMIILLFLIIPKQILKYTVNFQWEHLKAFLRGLVWNLKNWDIDGITRLQPVKKN